MNQNEEPKTVRMIKCPACSLELPEDDERAQMRHMENKHPDVIAKRLREAGIR